MSAATDKDRQPRTSGPPAAPAPVRPPHEVVHERLIEDYKKKHSKDPSSNIWYRLLEQAKAEVAAAHDGKRVRKARVLPGYLDSANIA